MALITVAARSELIALYTAMFKAAPGANNLTDMVAAYEAGGTTSSIAKTLAAKADFATVYPGFTTAAEFAASLVSNLLGSDVTAAITTWSTDYVVGLLNSGKTRADAIVTAVVALRATTNTGFTVAQAALANKVDVASYYSMTQGQSSTSLQVLQGVIAGVTSVAATTTAAKTAIDTTTVSASSQTFRLTTGIDTFTGSVGADKFTATPIDGFDSFTALDALDGGAGNDTLTVAAATALTIPAGATVTNIETASLASSTTVVADTSTWTGLTQLNLTSGTGTTAIAAATTNVTEAGSVNATTITGGNNVTVAHTTAGAVGVNGAAGAVTITNTLVSGATNVGGNTVALQSKGPVTVTAKGDVTVTGGTSLTATLTEATSYTTRVANAAAKVTSDALSSTTTLTDATGLIVTGLNTMAGAVAAAATPTANFTATTTAMNGGFITLAQKVSIDAAYTAAFKAVGGTAALAQAAALAVETPILAAAATANVNAGVTGAANATTQGVNNGLVTADAVPARTVSAIANTGLTSATVTGNYGGTTTITDASTGVNQLTTVTLDNSAAAALTGNALTNVSVSNVVGATGNVTITNATVGHTQNLTVSNVGKSSSTAPAFFVFTDGAATTLNVVSNGTTNVATLTAGAATAVNITGAGALQMNSTVTNGTGASTFAANAVITATNSSGANTVSVLAGQSYLGGSGTDVVYAAAGLQTAPVTGGAGTADKLIVTALANIAVNTLGTGSAEYTGFEILQNSTGDVIDLSTMLLGNTFTSVAFKTPSAATTALSQGTINGLNATQANAVTISTAANLSTGYTLGLTGATSVGQLDTVTVSAGAALGTLDVVGVETLNITPTAATSFNMSANSLSLSAINITGGSSAVLISGEGVTLNPNTVIDASKSTGKAMLNIISATNGAKLVGSATANNLLTTNAGSSVLVGGAGNDILRGGAGNDIISAGNGNNTVVAGNGTNTVTLGNGMNKVIGGTGVDTITVGTGSNWITTNIGLDVITLGTHAVGVVNTIDLSAGAAAGAANVKNVTGFVSGVDQINLAANSLAGLTLDGTTSQAAMLAPVTDVTSVATLTEVITALGTATGLVITTGNAFAASTALAGGLVARTVIYTTGAAAGTYLVINDGTAGFIAGNDIVIKLNGTTTVAAGDISATGTAFSVTPIQAFTATVGTDNFVGGDLADTFAAKFSTGDDANTLVAGDIMTGGAGSDTLTISPATTATGITIADALFANKTGIENLVISSTTATQSITLANANYEAGGGAGLGFNKITDTSTTGSVTIAAAGNTNAGTFIVSSTSGAIAITGSSAAVVNTITATTTLAGGTIAVTGGAGADIIGVTNALATSTITGGAGNDAITLGTHTLAQTIVLGSSFTTNGVDTITGFTTAVDKLNVDAFGTAVALTTVTGTQTNTVNTVYFLGAQAAGAADTIAASVTALAAAGAWTDAAVTSFIIVVDTNSTAVYEYTGDGAADDFTLAEFTLIATVGTALVAGDIIFA